MKKFLFFFIVISVIVMMGFSSNKKNSNEVVKNSLLIDSVKPVKSSFVSFKKETVVEKPILSIEKSVKNDSKISSFFSADEFKTISNAGKRNGLNDEQTKILFAIRKAENGKKGREMGVLHPKAVNTNLDTQAGWCAATIKKNYDRWENSGKDKDFVTFLGEKYCPVKAENDPKGLNKNWIGNVKKWIEKF